MENQLFSPEEGRPLDWLKFKSHHLGQLQLTIPFHEYEEVLPYKEPKTGPRPWFCIKGGIALQILKHYYKVSDAKLIDLLNENKILQYFCFINLKAGEKIKDRNIVSRWRGILGEYLIGDKLLEDCQKLTAQKWKPDLDQTKSNLSDATCYESWVRYPTDEKLLWECIEYLHGQFKVIKKFVGMPMFRSKYKAIKKAYLVHQKTKKKTHKKRRKIRKRLLHLLNKFMTHLPIYIGLMKNKESLMGQLCKVKSNFYKRIGLIKKVYQQQQLHFDYPEMKIKQRIISLAKPYLRPIVRGKEKKRVEPACAGRFGMKVHEMQIDGINWIEYGSFEAFHEGVRLKKTLQKHRLFFRTSCSLFGGDRIYANNKNRRYCKEQGIQTCFIPKGRRTADKVLSKQQNQLRQQISKERATRLEGSFGNKKNHYLLDKIKGRNAFTEFAWIFFGNLTANAVAMTAKKKKNKLKNKAPCEQLTLHQVA